MTTTQLIALDLVAAIATSAFWLAACILSAGLTTAVAPAKARVTLWLIGAGFLGTVGQGVIIIVLGQSGWWFIEEKILLALPLAAVAAIIAVSVVPRLSAGIRGSAVGPIVPTALLFATAAGAAGLAARLVVGYPLVLLPSAVLVGLVLTATWLGHALFAAKGRRLVSGISGLMVLVVVASFGFAWLSDVASAPALDAEHGHGASSTPAAELTSLTTLRTPADAAGVLRTFELVAQEELVELPSGNTVSAWTYGSLPGPELRVAQGDLVEVTLRNLDVAAGATIHWHGYDVPNGEDGVAGVTQDAVLPGESFVYRFVADQAGSYWYHTHQSSADGVRRGLYGTLVVTPPGGIQEQEDLVVAVHSIGGRVLLNGSDVAESTTIAAGRTMRLRLVNTDQLPRRFQLDGTAFEVAAVDGQELEGATPVENVALRIPAGGRYDVTFTMPEGGVRLHTDASSHVTLTLSPRGADAAPLPAPSAAPDLDLLGYGAGPAAELPAANHRVEATMVLDRLPRFLHGVPREGYTVNGEVFPHVASIEVEEGDVVELTVANRGWETHPMHIHGHHVLVISRNGVAATGAPLWLDTFDVQPGEVWVVALVADNPGIWMDHCHNLDHAAEGMMMALRYRGITSPFEQGGEHGNRSE